MNSAAERKPAKDATDSNGQGERKASFLDAMGIGPGEWLINSKPQIEGLNREGHGEIYRIWAVLDLASMGYQSPIAVKQVPIKKVKPSMEVLGTYQKREKDSSISQYALVPLAPSDIAQASGLHKSNVKRGLRELERMGHIQCEGNTANHVRIKFLPRPEKMKRVVRLDSSLPSVRCASDEVTIRFTAQTRKKYFPKLSGNLDLNPQGVVNPDYLTGAEELTTDLWLWADEAIKSEWALRRRALDARFGLPLTEEAQTNGHRGQGRTDPEAVSVDSHLGVKSNGAYKEERILERKDTSKEHSSIPEIKSSSSRKPDEEDFRLFKDAYPKHRLDEVKAGAVFQKLTRDERTRAISRLRTVYLGCPRWKDQDARWVPFASNFLRKNGDTFAFEADPPPAFSAQLGRADKAAELARRNREIIEEAKRKEAGK